jgi:hypothetical protein
VTTSIPGDLHYTRRRPARLHVVEPTNKRIEPHKQNRMPLSTRILTKTHATTQTTRSTPTSIQSIKEIFLARFCSCCAHRCSHPGHTCQLHLDQALKQHCLSWPRSRCVTQRSGCRLSLDEHIVRPSIRRMKHDKSVPETRGLTNYSSSFG